MTTESRKDMPSPWLALGDSITWGFPWGPAASWTNIVAERIGLPVRNEGVNGDTLAGMAGRLSVLLARGQTFRFAVWMGGSNDVYHGVPLEVMQRNAERIADLLDAAGVPHAPGVPIPILVNGFDERLDAYRAWLKSRFSNVIDFQTALSPQDWPNVLPDAVHPSEEGYRAMAEVALRSVTPLL